jgi:hypothetical protein
MARNHLHLFSSLSKESWPGAENLVLDSEHSIVSLPMSSSQTEVLLPVTTQSLFHTQTDTTIFPSISNFQDETPQGFHVALACQFA